MTSDRRTTARACPAPRSAPGRGAMATLSRRVGAHGRSDRRARRIAGLLRFAVFLLLVFVAVWAGVRVANATDGGEGFDGRVYDVQRGDTLWHIAQDEYESGLDLRAVVYAIREANGLDDALLQPGQELTLPYVEE